MTKPRLFPLIAMLALVGVAFLAYRPGLSGGFLFDDWVNLDALGATGPVDNWATFWRYVTSGTADPLGRPIALLSFLADANDWPAAPGPFLLHNLWLHLFNGLLLFGLVRELQRALAPGDRASAWIACLAAGCWLLHPLWVSSTLYAVQREAILPACFTFAALWGYARLRLRLVDSSAPVIAGLVACVAAGTLLAALSKANGILLPVYALALEATVFASPTLSPVGARAFRFRWFKQIVLVLPTLLVVAYVASNLRHANVPIPHRGWSILGRLLTEPRVIADYLQALLVPRVLTTGIFNDGYAASTGWLSPPSTLVGILLVIALLGLAAWKRRDAPALSAAILFYFAGHLIESTSVPLELYFEHRNYLPSALLFWPLAMALAAWSARPAYRLVVGGALLSFLAVTTFQRAALWGQPERMAALWAARNPESSRARAMAGIALVSAGRPADAAARLDGDWRRSPDDQQVALNYIDAACRSGSLSSDDSNRLRATFSRARDGDLMIQQWLSRAISLASASACPGMSLPVVAQWVEAFGASPAMRDLRIRDESIEPLLAEIAIVRGAPEAALQHYDRALSALPGPDAAARNTASLARAGYYRHAWRHLDFFETLKGKVPPPGRGMPWVHAAVLEAQGYWPRELGVLRAKLQAEIAPGGQAAEPVQ